MCAVQVGTGSLAPLGINSQGTSGQGDRLQSRRLPYAPIAQLDRATASGAVGRRFESYWAHQPSSYKSCRSLDAVKTAVTHAWSEGRCLTKCLLALFSLISLSPFGWFRQIQHGSSDRFLLSTARHLLPKRICGNHVPLDSLVEQHLQNAYAIVDVGRRVSLRPKHHLQIDDGYGCDRVELRAAKDGEESLLNDAAVRPPCRRLERRSNDREVTLNECTQCRRATCAT
jgi:hypothetical protein